MALPTITVIAPSTATIGVPFPVFIAAADPAGAVVNFTARATNTVTQEVATDPFTVTAADPAQVALATDDPNTDIAPGAPAGVTVPAGATAYTVTIRA